MARKHQMARPWARFFNYAQFPMILAITFLMIRYSFGYSTHPGAHVFIATLLIDVLMLRMVKRWNIANLGSVLILNAFGLAVIVLGSDPLELKVASWYVLCALLIALTTRDMFRARPPSTEKTDS